MQFAMRCPTSGCRGLGRPTERASSRIGLPGVSSPASASGAWPTRLPPIPLSESPDDMGLPPLSPIRRRVVLQKLFPHVLIGVEAVDDRVDEAGGKTKTRFRVHVFELVVRVFFAECQVPCVLPRTWTLTPGLKPAALRCVLRSRSVPMSALLRGCRCALSWFGPVTKACWRSYGSATPPRCSGRRRRNARPRYGSTRARR